MPITLNPAGKGVQDPRRAEMFVNLDLSKPDLDFVVYRKFVSNHPENDFVPQREKVWAQTSVGMPKALLELARKNPNFRHRLFTESADGTTAILGEDDGMIIHYSGTFAGDRYLDRGRIVSDEEAEVMMEAGNTLPQFSMWEFRISDVIATDGPQRRADILQSNDQKAARERESMFTAVAEAFAQLVPQTEPRTLEEAETGEAEAKPPTTPDMRDKMRQAMEAKG
jgi:hypothetical protein